MDHLLYISMVVIRKYPGDCWSYGRLCNPLNISIIVLLPWKAAIVCPKKALGKQNQVFYDTALLRLLC